MNRALKLFAAASTLVLGACAIGGAGGIAPPVLNVVVLGDSFSAALDLATLTDDEELSWATGTRLNSPSIVQRLEDEGWTVHASNVARSGNRVHDLHAQMSEAPDEADLVLVWIGTNDLCAPGLTLSEFETDLQAAFGAIAERYREAEILVFAPPTLPWIAAQHQTIAAASQLWDAAQACSEFFGATRLELSAQRRQEAFDDAISEAAAANGFHFSSALARMDRPLQEWAGWDYFHPSPRGSALFAQRAWPDVRRLVGPGPDPS